MRATMRLEKKWTIGDRGAEYEFNVKMRRLRGVNISEDDLQLEAESAVDAFAEALRERYRWVGAVYQTGRSGGWLAIVDKKGEATEDQIEEISELVGDSLNNFQEELRERFGEGGGEHEPNGGSATYQILDFTGRRIGSKGLSIKEARSKARAHAERHKEAVQVVPDDRDVWSSTDGERFYPKNVPEMEPNRGAPTPATLEDGTTVSVPDIKIMAMHPSYHLEPARGFAASLVVMSGQRSIGWMPIAVTGFDSVRDWMNGRGMAANARGTRNFRWGPCPYCGAEGWDTERSRGTGQFDHDRPQGGRCLQAAKAKRHVPNARGGADETAGWNEEAREDARLMAEFHRLDARLRKTAEEKGENSAAFRADYAKLQRAKKQVNDARERHAATRTSRPFR